MTRSGGNSKNVVKASTDVPVAPAPVSLSCACRLLISKAAITVPAISVAKRG